ncbi:MAG: HAD hydrolase-like protein [Actinomycetes bacterium]
MLTVGFDLDMTLVDSRAGIRACLEALADETDRTIDADAIVAQLGPPIRRALADAFAEHELDDAVRRFRVHMASFGAAMATPMPGAGDAIASVQSLGGRVLVVTAKHQPLAEVTMTATRLATDALVGDLWGVDKALALREWSAQIYVGDHWADVHAARAADATSVVVLTGGIDRRSLEDASPDAILTDLGEFPDWLAQRYVRRR